jgi:hypothetical protein
MSDGVTKTRIISFRVSDEEYRVVNEESKKVGFASVSLFARSATLTGNRQEPTPPIVPVDVQDLWSRVDALTAALEHIATHLCVPIDLSKITCVNGRSASS